MQGYSNEDVWNLGETGIFWKALLNKGFGRKVKNAKVEKNVSSDLHYLIVDGAGNSENKPIILWKCENPRCFKRINRSELPVDTLVSERLGCRGKFHTMCSLELIHRSKVKGDVLYCS